MATTLRSWGVQIPAELVEDPEHDNVYYAEFPDGLRLKFEDDKYAGYYNCKAEGE